jgi:hypothetical protein
VICVPIQKQVTLWTGFPGAPGYTTLYWNDVTGPNLVALQAFWTGIADRLPSNTTIQVQSTGDRLDEATGAVIGAWSGAAQTPIVGTGAGAYSAVSGAHINWRTAAIVAGRRVRGRSFLVPLYGGAYDSDGTIAATVLTDLRTNLATFVAAAAADLRVWHRPVGGSGGSAHAVTAADIPDKAAALRSRRD